MARVDDKITYDNFGGTYQDYSTTIGHNDRNFYYIHAESWGIEAVVLPHFLADWHGWMYIDIWTGNGWLQIHKVWLQDTSSAKYGRVKFKAEGLNFYDLYGKIPSGYKDYVNLFRIRFENTKWHTDTSLNIKIYVGDCQTLSRNDYNLFIKNNKIYSNGTIGQDKCGVLWSSNSLSDSAVLSYFASNKGTKIQASYARYCVRGLI